MATILLKVESVEDHYCGTFPFLIEIHAVQILQPEGGGEKNQQGNDDV